MPLRFKLIDPGFSTADTEYPSFEFRDGDLTLEFIDWQEQAIRVVFHDVAGMQWNDEAEFHGDDIRDDSSYEVCESEWLAKHISLGTFSESEGYRHFVLCFNAAGVLDVLCKQVQLA